MKTFRYDFTSVILKRKIKDEIIRANLNTVKSTLPILIESDTNGNKINSTKERNFIILFLYFGDPYSLIVIFFIIFLKTFNFTLLNLWSRLVYDIGKRKYFVSELGLII